jgi:FkbM family methyltransferase
MQVFDQIFISREYSCLRDLKEPRLVLDLGANVGFSAAYFLNAFPKVSVLAVEPDERNLAICKNNLAPYGDRVLLLHGAVWSRPATLRVLTGNFGDGREWATQVEELNANNERAVCVQAWDVGSLIDMSGCSSVDLLKVDIERAEIFVFREAASSWLSKVRNICIELHGRDCEKVFFAALRDYEYELGHSGELTTCRNLRPRKATPTVPNPA